MKIKRTQITHVSEKLKSPLGFKGGFLTELWQVVVRVEDENNFGVGVGVQSVLWSDAEVFVSNTETKGNEYMYELTSYALDELVGKEGNNPIELMDLIFPSVYDYAKTLTNVKDKIRETFVRNALVAVDNALWQLYGKNKKEENLFNLVPQEYQSSLSAKQQYLCNIPLISYGVSEEDIKNILDGGASLLKIKIGFDNNKKMDKEEMVEWDKKRLLQIHEIAKNYRSKYSNNGHILYYLDANGKYDSLERVENLLEFAKKHGFLNDIVLFEEPFEENNLIDVSSLPVRIVADESLHSLKDVKIRLSLGYKAFALKPIAKTLSETLKILRAAHENNVICFCADLTVNPLLVEWNKNIASRINSLPEMNVGILESNGEQNYANYIKMYEAHPLKDKSFVKPYRYIYTLNDEFYSCSGGIFKDSKYYLSLLK